MDWTNERYVRVYTRDTTSWLMLPWQGRALLPLLLRKVDRAGVMDLPSCDHSTEDVLSVMVGLPPDVVVPGLAALLSQGAVEVSESALVIPNFLEAQEAQQSAAQRQREARAKRRARARSGAGAKPSPKRREGPPKADHGFVYFIQADSGEVKIGSAADVNKRIGSLRTASPHELTLVATVEDGRREADIQAIFAEDRIRGEWFKPSHGMDQWLNDESERHAALQAVTKRDTQSRNESQPSLQPSLAKPTLEEPPVVPLGDPPPPKRKRKPAKVAMPDGWTPNDAAAARAADLGLDVAAEADDFREWTGAKAATYANWDAAFMSHLRRRSADGKKRPPLGGTRGADLGGDLVERARRIRAEQDRQEATSEPG